MLAAADKQAEGAAFGQASGSTLARRARMSWTSVIVRRVWSPERVREVAASLLDGDGVDSALAAIQPGWRLLWGVDDAQAVVRVGGPAGLVEGEEWPRNPRGIALTLLCEIDTGRLPAMPEEWRARVNLPADAGVLRVFGDLVDEPYGAPPAVISPRPPGEPRRVAAPTVPEPFPPGGPDDTAATEHRVRELPGTACSAAPFLTLPEWRPGTEWEDDMAWQQLSYLVRVERDITWLQDPMRDGAPDPWSISHVLGEPTSVQDDVRIDAAHGHIDPQLRDLSAWQVLVALHSGSHLSIFDAGAYWVLVPRQDLAAARWDRAILTSSSA